MKNQNLLWLFLLFPILAFGSDEKKSESIQVQDLELFNKVLYILETQYFQKIDNQKLINGAIKGMMSVLDPHSAYLDVELYKKIQDETNGEFEGIGVEITQKEGSIIIVTTQSETPAYEAGIRAGDKIVRVNGKSTLGLGLVEVTQIMRGKKGEVLKLEVMREGQAAVLSFQIKRKKIKVKSVISSLMSNGEDNDFLFIRVSQFQRDVSAQVKDVLKKHKDNKLKGIILDLRSNPGGLLDQAVELVSLFVDEGIVVSSEDRSGKIMDVRKVVDLGFRESKVPMAVLVNGASASASEIVAGALQDLGRAIIMGGTTFGKGSIQSLIPLNKEVALKLTVAQYVTPKGRKIQALGIHPDVELDEYDLKMLKDNKKRPKYLRESDLRNHLLSETEKKQKSSEKGESKDGAVGGQNESDEGEVKGPEDLGYNPKQDFQVQQAVNILKSSQLMKTK
ncbi:MAG: S41 family peptidase [Bacteriovoracaceae bacterium]|nr:S41 family peptidase [Bacteriovoracaceae bacterium]